MPVEQLTPERIMYETEHVLQSHEDLHSNQTFDVNLIHVVKPEGLKGKKIINISKCLREKHCFIRILNKDELCVARAIVVGVARVKKDPRYSQMLRGRPIQRTRALELHGKAGAELKACGLDEVKRFQTVLTDYQLVIVSAQHYNSIIYKGQNKNKFICT